MPLIATALGRMRNELNSNAGVFDYRRGVVVPYCIKVTLVTRQISEAAREVQVQAISAMPPKLVCRRLLVGSR